LRHYGCICRAKGSELEKDVNAYEDDQAGYMTGWIGLIDWIDPRWIHDMANWTGLEHKLS